jgi:two-component system response regulator AtoC
MSDREILIVDDDPDVRRSLAEALANEGTKVAVAEDAERALALLARETADVVVSDIRMPGLSGLELLPLLREGCPDTDVVLMTAYDDMDTVVSAMKKGAADFLVKPIDLHELRRTLLRLFADREMRERRTPGSYERPQGPLIGRDPAIIDIYKTIGRAAGTASSVLIRGESGTGKELVARAIHAHSPRVEQPFVAVNCAALPAGVLESELFGHVRGSFTGAVNARQGRFALAGKGTIFLDEIGDTTQELQTKLLRVLQEREYEPVGAERVQRVEARVIAATHRNLERLIENGAFREDLYYRLRVVEIVIPPLRERMADLQMLVDHFVRRASLDLGMDAPVTSPEALAVLKTHRWPGNVRELENCVARAVVLAAGGVIRPEHLRLTEQAEQIAGPLSSLEEIERVHLERVLLATGGHKARTASILGVSRPRLNRLLRKHGLA